MDSSCTISVIKELRLKLRNKHNRNVFTNWLKSTYLQLLRKSLILCSNLCHFSLINPTCKQFFFVLEGYDSIQAVSEVKGGVGWGEVG